MKHSHIDHAFCAIHQRNKVYARSTDKPFNIIKAVDIRFESFTTQHNGDIIY